MLQSIIVLNLVLHSTVNYNTLHVLNLVPAPIYRYLVPDSTSFKANRILNLVLSSWYLHKFAGNRSINRSVAASFLVTNKLFTLCRRQDCGASSLIIGSFRLKRGGGWRSLGRSDPLVKSYIILFGSHFKDAVVDDILMQVHGATARTRQRMLKDSCHSAELARRTHQGQLVDLAQHIAHYVLKDPR